MRKKSLKRFIAALLMILMVFNCSEPYYTFAQDLYGEEDNDDIASDSINDGQDNTVSSGSMSDDSDETVSSDDMNEDSDNSVSSDNISEESDETVSSDSVSNDSTSPYDDIEDDAEEVTTDDNPLPPEGFESDFMYIVEIEPVHFRNAEHIAIGGKSSTSKIADLNVSVWAGLKGWSCPSELEKDDYSISYKNNKYASVTYDADGNVVPLYKSDAERPTVIVKGKGLYKGLSVIAYFDIYPLNLLDCSVWKEKGPDEEEKGFGPMGIGSYTWIKGLKMSYYLNSKGKISEKVSLSASRDLYVIGTGVKKDKTVTAKLEVGKDYIQHLYRWNNNTGCWDKESYVDINQISVSGDYLVVLEGINNYCGIVCGNDSSWGNCGHNIEFRDGKNGAMVSPQHYNYQSIPEEGNWTGWQFRVADAQDLDLSKASIKIKNAVIPYDGKYHDLLDFGLSVTVGKGEQKKELEEGLDYNITLRADSCLYDNEDIKTGQYGEKARVCVSNKYTVILSAKEGSDYFGVCQAEKKIWVKGLALKASYFKCGIGEKYSKSAKFTGKDYEIRYELSAAGKKSGINFSNGEYAVYCTNLKPYKARVPGKYYINVYAKGPGVDHSVMIKKLALNIKAGSLKYLVDNGLITFSFSDAIYNPSGSYPVVTVRELSPYGSTYTKSFQIEKNHFKKDVYMFGSLYTLEFTLSGKNKKGGEIKVKVRCIGKGAFSGSVSKDAKGEKLYYHIL